MPVDTGIYANLLRAPKSIADYDAEAQAVQGNALAMQMRRQQIEGNALSMRQAQQKQAESDADTNALRSLAGGWNAQTTPEQRIAGLRNSGRASLMGQADTLERQAIERQRGEAEARSKQADVLSKVLTAQGELAGRVMAMPTRESAAAAIANMKAITQALGVPLDLSADEAAIGQFTSPDQIKQWAAGVALKAEQLLPKLQALNAGGQYVNQAVNPITGAVAETGRTDITQSADNAATQATARANQARMSADAAAGRAVTMRGQNMTDARARESGERAGGGRTGPMSVTLQKELLESDDAAQSSAAVVSTLTKALDINKQAYSGYLAKPRATLRSNLPGQSDSADATINLDNMMTGQALESLKVTFGAAPTEGERKILMDMQASADKTPKQREEIINRAIAAAQRRGEFAARKAESIRSGKYLTEGVSPAGTAAPAAAPATAGPKVGAVVDGYRFKGGDPSKQASWEKQ